MAVQFYVARLDDELAAGTNTGWGVVREEAGHPKRFVSRIFFRREEAEAHARRLTQQEAERKSIWLRKR
jgi:hypothetical protein